MKEFFAQEKEELFESFHSSDEGLSSAQVEAQKEKYGENQLVQNKKKTLLQVFFDQFKDLLVAILLVAALISAFSGNVESTIVIFAVLLLNAILGVVQHKKAEQSLDSLKKMTIPEVKVVRDGQTKQIASKDLVPGDLLLLEAGDLIAADGRILETASLQVNESALTGESLAVDKISQTIVTDKLALGDQKNMVFSGSLVLYGRGKVLVTSTGMDTQLGQIATLMNQVSEKKTPLQRNLDDFSKKLAIVITVICALVFGLGLYHQMPILDSLMFAVALAVAAIPEALSSIVTIVLALGTQKMAKEQAIMKDLQSVESLGAVSVICSDKTGTLTQNKMTVRDVFVDNRLLEGKNLDQNNTLEKLLLEAAVFASDASIVEGQEIGDPTEVALVKLAQELGINEVQLREDSPRLGELPFDSDRKLMSTCHLHEGEKILFCKGALDILLKRCTHALTAEGWEELNSENQMKILKVSEELSKKGLRVLAFGYKLFDHPETLTMEDEKDFLFLGLIAMIDPPREESKKAVETAKNAGIRTIMITGDHVVTASAIAREIGILNEGDMTLDGLGLDQLTDSELDDILPKVVVYARVSPANKIRIVEAWQRRGEIVAMTGDGVNDAPALKKADIGIAMGITGTEVSKDAASMILADDNFATIIRAVANGRNVFEGIKNAIKFLLSGNTAGIFAVLYTSMLGLPAPFAPVQLLFMNLLTDSLPAIAVGMEISQDDLLEKEPRNPKAPILSGDLFGRILVEGFQIAVVTLISYYIGLQTSAHMATSMAFITLTFARLLHGFNSRGKKPLHLLKFTSNKFSVAAFLVGVVLLALVLFVPFVGRLFETDALRGTALLFSLGLSFIPTLIIQTYKTIRYYAKHKKK